MNYLTINEMRTGSYMERTAFNANKTDLTIACAIDYNTPGEKYTEKVAGTHYLRLPLSIQAIESARALFRIRRDNNWHSINIAGNGMHTLSKHAIEQRRVNLWIYDLLSINHIHMPIKKLQSGGQTGVDIAAAVVGPMLQINTEINFPNGYKQRKENGIDILQTLDDVMQSIESMREELEADLKAFHNVPA